MSMHELIGKPVLSGISSRGFIARVFEPQTASFTLGAGRMDAVREEFEIVWESGRVDTAPDTIARGWIEAAQRANLPAVDDVEALKTAALQKQAEARQQAQHERDERRARELAFQAEAEHRMPFGAKAVIVAELHNDESDSMTDYFHHSIKRTVILGFSNHTRDLFPELRKLAGLLPETAELVDAPDNAEHREKYSMGAGFYLKNGFRNSTGWAVRKMRLYDGHKSIPVGEWLPDPEPVQPSSAVAVGGLPIEKHTHSKHGFDMWIVIMPDRVPREEYDFLLNMAKDFGGWYSKRWGSSPAGFAFKDEAKAKQFAEGAAGNNDGGDSPTPPPAGNSAVSEKLRGLADGMQGEIDHKLANWMTNTPKRQREAAAARHEGEHLRRTQQALRALADMHESGTVPAVLSSLRTKAAIHPLTRSEIDRSNAGYYDAGVDTGKPALDTPQALAVWALLKPKTEAERRADQLRAKSDALLFANIPGFFPTPAAVVDQMIDLAALDDVDSILEPEGGSGAILDRVRSACPGARLVTYERHSSLREILQLKGYEIPGTDFLEADESQRFDRVLMNPPFENGQDIDHVMKAYRMLADGGRLVAIMSTGPFFRSDRKAQAFRQWFDDLNGYKIDLPANSFKESGTGTATIIVVIEAGQ
jgi:hypothetical protein